jgi:signal transduction histidine kinase
VTVFQRWVAARRSGLYLLGSLVSGVVTLVGLPLLCHPALARQWADRQRQRAARLIGPPFAPAATSGGRDEAGPGTARDLLWLPVNVLTGTVLGLFAVLCLGNIVLAVVATPLWWAFDDEDRPRLFMDLPVTSWTVALTLGPAQILLLAVVAYLGFAPAAGAHARTCLAVLRPSAAEQLTERVAVLTRTRADVLQAHGAELRRIERDLHDGTQARLVTIAVQLAVARRALFDPLRDRQYVDELLREAHEGTEEAMIELRDVIRSVYPPILADRGLDGALTAVTARCAVATSLEHDDLGRIPAAVEAVVYYAVTEALTNVVRHSQAAGARVFLQRNGTRLIVGINDDGVGGADHRLGTGLAGIRRRVLALDGTFDISSPLGGPTVLTLELACE